ncbi:hypothetical protein PMI09_05150 [Rhizobium sp. CF122]|uniref:hypothetical protein n=1 Tax=Rhizobium sp. CF122 TaxID=1144312 RepID=UPI000271CB88|nr:hypothetical protein [Rhizobium sp. CF122]EJL50299.1 hypothetical protein PMI09_05150 [Rhizobium sp. CF122]
MKSIDSLRMRVAGGILLLLWIDLGLLALRLFAYSSLPATVVTLCGVAIVALATILWFIDRAGAVTRVGIVHGTRGARRSARVQFQRLAAAD